MGDDTKGAREARRRELLAAEDECTSAPSVPSAWVPVVRGGHFNAIWGSGAGDIFAVGENGLIHHSSDGGVNWEATFFKYPEEMVLDWGDHPQLSAVCGSGDDVYAVGGRRSGRPSTILCSADRGRSWQAVSIAKEMENWLLYDVWCSGPNDVYAVGSEATILHSTDHGESWVKEDSGESMPSEGNGIWGSGPNDVFVACKGIRHSVDRGKTWAKRMDRGGPIAGFGDDIYTVSGYDIFASHDHGITWGREESRGAHQILRDVWAGPNGEAWAVGTSRTILHRASGQAVWTQEFFMSKPGSLWEIDLNGVWGDGCGNVWVTGYFGISVRRS